jgi:hypothetical protein
VCNPHYREGGLLGDFPAIAEIYISKDENRGEGSYSLANGRKCGHSRVVGAKKSHNIEHNQKIYRS